MSTPVTMIDLKRMTVTELRREIAVHATEYAKMRMRVELQNEKNHALFKSKRREIARMHTVLTAMESGMMKASKVSVETSAPESSDKSSQTKKKPVKVSRSK